MNIIAKKIRTLRKDANLTQQEVADQLKISQNAYSKIELGYTDISFSRIQEFASIFQVSAAYLVSNQDPCAKPESLICLTKLVLLKRYKEVNGSDDYYLAEQPKAWQDAHRIVTI